MTAFSLSGSAARLLRDGSPGDDVHEALRAAPRRRVGRGWRYDFDVPVEVAERIADYLDSVAGVVGEMTGAEREGGREHEVARDAVEAIDAALKAP